MDNIKKRIKKENDYEDLKTTSSSDMMDDTYHQNNEGDYYNRNGRKNKQVIRTTHYIIFGITSILIGIILLSSLPDYESVNESPEAREAMDSRLSSELSIGARILKDDEEGEPVDYTIEHSNEGTTKIYIWDYAAVDGDYVQVIVDGKPYTSGFVINYEPKEFEIPATCEVQVLGVRDGGGGITYGIHYEANSYTYFNTAPEGEENTYTVIFNSAN